jgi:hypothetical protein
VPLVPESDGSAGASWAYEVLTERTEINMVNNSIEKCF